MWSIDLEDFIKLRDEYEDPSAWIVIFLDVWVLIIDAIDPSYVINYYFLIFE